MKTEVYARLKSRFPSDQFALLDEVRDAAGFGASNSIDALAIGLWPSRGHEVHGIEIKSNRGDWLRELKNPKKQETIFQYCDRFWLLATDEFVVKDIKEIPASWGYMLIKGEKIFVKKEAPALKPKDLTRSFIGAVLKRATSRLIHPSEIDGKIRLAVDNAVRAASGENTRMKNEYENLKNHIQAIEKETGFSIYDFSNYWRSCERDPVRIGNAINVVLKNEESIDWHYSKLTRLKNELEEAALKVSSLLENQMPKKQQEPVSITGRRKRKTA